MGSQARHLPTGPARLAARQLEGVGGGAEAAEAMTCVLWGIAGGFVAAGILVAGKAAVRYVRFVRNLPPMD